MTDYGVHFVHKESTQDYSLIYPRRVQYGSICNQNTTTAVPQNQVRSIFAQPCLALPKGSSIILGIQLVQDIWGWGVTQPFGLSHTQHSFLPSLFRTPDHSSLRLAGHLQGLVRYFFASHLTAVDEGFFSPLPGCFSCGGFSFPKLVTFRSYNGGKRTGIGHQCSLCSKQKPGVGNWKLCEEVVWLGDAGWRLLGLGLQPSRALWFDDYAIWSTQLH